jgi:hypothetical protein
VRCTTTTAYMQWLSRDQGAKNAQTEKALAGRRGRGAEGICRDGEGISEWTNRVAYCDAAYRGRNVLGGAKNLALLSLMLVAV